MAKLNLMITVITKHKQPRNLTYLLWCIDTAYDHCFLERYGSTLGCMQIITSLPQLLIKEAT